jgi:hypothetical protein
MDFDTILKKAQKQAQTGGKTKKDKWQEMLSAMMAAVLQLNQMYGKDDMHHIALEQHMCANCNKAMFVILARDIGNEKRLMRFHPSGCKLQTDNTYRCEACAKK